MPTSPKPARLVVVQGPLQAITASAAVLHRSAGGQDLLNVLLIGGMAAFHSDDRDVLVGACVACATAVDWQQVIAEPGLERADAVRAAVHPSVEIAEVLCVRNFQPVNDAVLAAYPSAQRVVYGDSLGVLDVDPSPHRPQFHVAAPIIPIPDSREVIDRLKLEPVPGERLIEVLTRVRESKPELVELDRQLAGFVRGGLLLMPSFLAECRAATLRQQLAQSLYLARRLPLAEGAPVVIKPHPRSSLGQAAAMARAFRREGRPVRIMSRHDCGHYPIELFEQLAKGAAYVEATTSFAAVSLKYLYGVDASRRLPPLLARLTLSPQQWTQMIAGNARDVEVARLLPSWDGHSPMPPSPSRHPKRWHKMVSRTAYRLLHWRPTDDLPRRQVPWRGEQAVARVKRLWAAVDADGHRPAATAAPVAWVMPRGARAPAEAQDVEMLIGTTIERLQSLEPGTRFGLVCGTAPSSHTPVWRHLIYRLVGAPAVAGAILSAEEVEELLELHVDVLVRVPEAVRGASAVLRRRMPVAHVAFLCATRASQPRPPVASAATAEKAAPPARP